MNLKIYSDLILNSIAKTIYEFSNDYDNAYDWLNNDNFVFIHLIYTLDDCSYYTYFNNTKGTFMLNNVFNQGIWSTNVIHKDASMEGCVNVAFKLLEEINECFYMTYTD